MNTNQSFSKVFDLYKIEYIWNFAVNGGWANWSSWTPCSKTCGQGKTHRYQTCTSPEKKGQGLDCIGGQIDKSYSNIIKRRRQENTCNPQSCPGMLLALHSWAILCKILYYYSYLINKQCKQNRLNNFRYPLWLCKRQRLQWECDPWTCIAWSCTNFLLRQRRM